MTVWRKKKVGEKGGRKKKGKDGGQEKKFIFKEKVH